MAKRRMISTSIWDDPDVGELSGDAFRLFIGLISNADDDGRIDADPRQLRKIIFGYQPLTTNQDVERLRAEVCEHLKNVILYTVEGKEYIVLRKWTNVQHVPKDKYVASVLPEPPSDPGPPELAPLEAGSTGGMPGGYRRVTDGDPEDIVGESRLVQVSSAQDREVEDVATADQSKELKASGKAPKPFPKKASATRDANGTQVPTGFVVTPEMKTWAAENAPGIDAERETEKFVDYYRSKGSTSKDWIATWRNWMRRAHEFKTGRSNQNGKSTTAGHSRGAAAARAFTKFAEEMASLDQGSDSGGPHRAIAGPPGGSGA